MRRCAKDEGGSGGSPLQWAYYIFMMQLLLGVFRILCFESTFSSYKSLNIECRLLDFPPGKIVSIQEVWFLKTTVLLGSFII